jgi:hypothetical protein
MPSIRKQRISHVLLSQVRALHKPLSSPAAGHVPDTSIKNSSTLSFLPHPLKPLQQPDIPPLKPPRARGQALPALPQALCHLADRVFVEGDLFRSVCAQQLARLGGGEDAVEDLHGELG